MTAEPTSSAALVVAAVAETLHERALPDMDRSLELLDDLLHELGNGGPDAIVELIGLTVHLLERLAVAELVAPLMLLQEVIAQRPESSA